MIVDKITRLATEFRHAIERTDKSMLPIGLRDFPRGSCGDAVLLLGAFLIDNGIIGFEYVCGERGDVSGESTWSSHAWLQRDKLVVDITADQFPEITDAVIVGYGSRWHAGWRVEFRNHSNFRRYDAATSRRLQAAYDVICARLYSQNT